ncbi:MAG: sugar-binding transcriptional regulator [Anaerolineaceae bacterium]|nr:sugar-binding transcriptional regulator [Anaerolineaceae bacterium]
MKNNSKDGFLNAGNSRKEHLLRIAWLYYFEQLTQAEIGERLGLSRVTVNRLLKEARDSKLVEIKLNADDITPFELSQKLVTKYNLKEVFISPNDQAEDSFTSLARMGALAFRQYLKPNMTVGVGFGRSLVHLPDFFESDDKGSCRFTSLIGGLDFSLGGRNHNFDILSRLAQKVNGQAVYIPAPIFVSNAATRDIFIQDPSVQRSLQIAAASDIIILSTGEVGPSSLLYQLGVMTGSELQELRNLKACGDLLGHFFGHDGKELDTEFNRRVIGLSLQQVAKAPVSILVAGGEEKHKAIQAALRGSLINVLVTDTATAQFLLDEDCLNKE